MTIKQLRMYLKKFNPNMEVMFKGGTGDEECALEIRHIGYDYVDKYDIIHNDLEKGVREVILLS